MNGRPIISFDTDAPRQMRHKQKPGAMIELVCRLSGGIITEEIATKVLLVVGVLAILLTMWVLWPERVVHYDSLTDPITGELLSDEF